MVPGVSVIEFAKVAIPIELRWLALTTVNAGHIGSPGVSTILVTAQADFAISPTSHGK
jgi:hypothetical protein